jgi:hypothetical protein
MRNESAAQPFEAELDRYVESVVLPRATELGDGGALAAWMMETAAEWRKGVAIARCWMRKADAGLADQAISREIAPLGSYHRAVQNDMLARDLAIADLLEHLASISARSGRHARVTDWRERPPSPDISPRRRRPRRSRWGFRLAREARLGKGVGSNINCHPGLAV